MLCGHGDDSRDDCDVPGVLRCARFPGVLRGVPDVRCGFHDAPAERLKIFRNVVDINTKKCPCYKHIFLSCENLKIFSRTFFDIFLIFAPNIDCGYSLEPPRHCGHTLEPPRQGGSNEYPQSMFWIKNKKKYQNISIKNSIFLQFRKDLYVTWACFRNRFYGASSVITMIIY